MLKHVNSSLLARDSYRLASAVAFAVVVAQASLNTVFSSSAAAQDRPVGTLEVRPPDSSPDAPSGSSSAAPSAAERSDSANAGDETEVPALLDTDEIKRLIEQLDSPKFQERRAATQRLMQGGDAVVGPLTEAAQSTSAEVSKRAVEVLKHGAQSGHPALKTAATEALKKLTEGPHKVAARLAAEALKPLERAANDDPFAPAKVAPGQPQAAAIAAAMRRAGIGGPVVPGVPGLPGPRLPAMIPAPGIQIQAQAIIGNGVGRRTRIQVNGNGQRTTEVTENGRTVKIDEFPGGKIKVEITETKDGKPATKSFEADNVEDLKKKSPEAHKAYEDYGRKAGGIQINAGQAVPGLPRLPGVPGLPGAPGLPGVPGAPAIPAAPRIGPPNAPAPAPAPRAQPDIPDIRRTPRGVKIDGNG